MLEQTLEEARTQETQRIKRRLRQLTPEEQKIYMEAYGTALTYCHKFILSGRVRKLIENYFP